MTDAEIAWVAGIIEGEGCVSLKGKSGVKILVNMTDEDTIEKLLSITNVGAMRGPYRWREQHLQYWTWDVGKHADVIPLLRAILPWMSQRRTTKILEALEHSQNRTLGTIRPIKHGTSSGHVTELKRGLSPCDECKAAKAAYYRGYRLRKAREKW